MIYTIELKNTGNGDIDYIEAKDTMRLNRLADEIRKTMYLPYDEHVRYRKTFCNGYIYMQGDVISDYVDALYEGADDPDDLGKKAYYYHERNYRAEESTPISELFTTIGSAFNFRQGYDNIRCTLIEKR